MKRRNGFFSFSIVTVAVLTLSLALTAATLAWQHFQMARTYEETVRLTYLAESALCEGWNQLRQDPDAFLAGQAMAVPRAEGPVRRRAAICRPGPLRRERASSRRAACTLP